MKKSYYFALWIDNDIIQKADTNRLINCCSVDNDKKMLDQLGKAKRRGCEFVLKACNTGGAVQPRKVG